MYNVVLFSDLPFAQFFSRNFGMHRLATELRGQGYTVLCVNYISSINYEDYCQLIDLAVGPETLMVGFSTTWLPYLASGSENNGRAVIGSKLFFAEYDSEQHPWYFESMGYRFTQEGPKLWTDYIKQKNPKTKITVGGCKAASYVTFPEIDYAFIGAGETMAVDFVNSLSGKGPKRIFNKVIDYDRNAQNPQWEFRESFTQYIEEDLLRSTEFINIEFSRGCMFQCAFCSYPLLGQTSARDIIKYKETIRKELMDNWEKWGVTKYLIVDHTFNDSTFKLELVKEVIDSLPFKPSFWAYARIDLFPKHPEHAQLLLDIGVKEVLFGFESLNPATGKAIKKAHRVNTLKGLKIAKAVWKDDVFLTASAILGLPKETIKSFEETIEWFVNDGHNYIDHLDYSPLTLVSSLFDTRYAETSIIDRDMAKFGYSLGDDLNWIKDDGTDIVSRDQTIELIKKWYDVYNTINKEDKQLFWLSGYEAVSPEHAYDKLRERPGVKYFGTLSKEHGSPADLYRKYTSTLYWPELFTILQRKSISRN